MTIDLKEKAFKSILTPYNEREAVWLEDAEAAVEAAVLDLSAVIRQPGCNIGCGFSRQHQHKDWRFVHDAHCAASRPASAEASAELIVASSEHPLYRVVEHDDTNATRTYFIVCDEGWRESIVCERMYKWAADWLVEQLQGKPYASDRRPGK